MAGFKGLGDGGGGLRGARWVGGATSGSFGRVGGRPTAAPNRAMSDDRIPQFGASSGETVAKSIAVGSNFSNSSSAVSPKISTTSDQMASRYSESVRWRGSRPNSRASFPRNWKR